MLRIEAPFVNIGKQRKALKFPHRAHHAVGGVTIVGQILAGYFERKGPFSTVMFCRFDYHVSTMNAKATEAQEHHRNGFQLLSESSYQKARDEFLNAIEKNPEWASPHLGLGQTYFFQENPDLNEATKSFRRVVELKPDWVEGYHWLGAAQQQARTLEDAVKSYREAVRIAPSDTRPLIALGVCLTEMGQFAEAVVCLRHAVALNPPYAIASAHLFLADALRASGEREAACQEWQLVLGLSSDYPEYDSAKQEAAKRLAEHCGSARKRGHKR